MLYDVFEYYGASYSPTLTDDAKLSFWAEFTRRLFERTNVRAPAAVDYAQHAQAIRDIMGPNCFAVFDESLQVLRGLKQSGLRLGVISDWQKGLAHFCDELGLGTYLEESDIEALSKEMEASGVRERVREVFAGGLSPAREAKSLRAQPDGKVLITDGPYLETKEHVGGLSIVEAADMDEVLTWARKGAVVCRASGEVRPFFRSNTPSE